MTSMLSWLLAVLLRNHDCVGLGVAGSKKVCLWLGVVGDLFRFRVVLGW